MQDPHKANITPPNILLSQHRSEGSKDKTNIIEIEIETPNMISSRSFSQPCVPSSLLLREERCPAPAREERAQETAALFPSGSGHTPPPTFGSELGSKNSMLITIALHWGTFARTANSHGADQKAESIFGAGDVFNNRYTPLLHGCTSPTPT